MKTGRSPFLRLLGRALACWLLGTGAAAAAGEFEAEVLPGLVKVGPGVEWRKWALPGGPEVHAARNEYEVFQIAVVNPASAPAKARVSVKACRGRRGRLAAREIRCYREEFIRVRIPSDGKSRPGWYPDALIPLVDGVWELAPGLNLLLVEIHVPFGQPAGEYRGAVAVALPERRWTWPVRLRVWDFTLPARASLKTAFGLDFDSLRAKEGIDPDAAPPDPRLVRYYELLARHRISPISVYPEPVYSDADGGLSTSACDRLWHYCYDELQFNTLRIPYDESAPIATSRYPLFSEAYCRRAENYLAVMAAYLRRNGWLDRSYIYISTVDEPADSAGYAKSRLFYDLVKAADPRIRYRHGEQIDFRRENIGKYDILDVNLLAFARHRKVLAGLSGVELGWYTAVGPKGDYPTYFIDRPALEPRILCLLNYYCRVERLLYWNLTWWRQVDDPYADPMTYTSGSDLFANGDGSLLYPAAPRHLSEPAASLRLKMIRDGVEDYEYCALLERRRGRAFVVREIGAVLADLTHFARSPEDISALRLRLGRLLHAEAKNR